MTRDEIRGLIGGYATGTLTEAERKILFEAALQDQDLFDELAREQALKEALEEPGAKQRVIAALERPKNRWPHAWVWAATAAAVVALVAGRVLLRPGGVKPSGVGVDKVDQVARLDTPTPVARPPLDRAPVPAPTPEPATKREAAPKIAAEPERRSSSAASSASASPVTSAPAAAASTVRDSGPARAQLDAPVAPAPKTAPALAAPTAEGGGQLQKSEAQTPKQADAAAADSLQVAGAVSAGLQTAGAQPSPLGFAPQGLSQLPGRTGQAGKAGTLAAPTPAPAAAPNPAQAPLVAATPGPGGAAAAGGGRGGGGGGGRGGRGGGRGGAVGGAANAVRAVPAPQAPAQAQPQLAGAAAASRFAFDYQVTPAGVLRVTPAANGFLTVNVGKAAVSSPLILGRSLQANAVTEVQLPADIDTVTVVFSAQERPAGAANAITGSTDPLASLDPRSGTKTDPNPTANSVVYAVIRLRP